MFRRSWLGAGLVAVAIAMAFALPAVASAAYANPDCTGCHASTLGTVPAQDFSVGDVDFDTACKKCHDDSLVGSHPYHNPTSNCGATCHPEMGPALVTAVPTHEDVRGYGAFASATSADTDPSLLHLIHSKPRWMESMQFPSSTCGSCHAVATCDSCHDNPPAPDSTTHANHAASLSLTPWVGNTSSGVTAGDQTENTYVVGNTSRCGAVGCHDTAGVATSAPGLQDDRSHGPDAARGFLANTVVKTGTWKVLLANTYTMGQTSQSNIANSTLSITFTGEQVVLLADKDPYRGIAEIKIDGVSQGFVDMYQDTTKSQAVVFKSVILPTSGPHTITVRATGTKSAAARAAYIRVDQFQVYNRVPGKVAPECASCHPGNADPHGMGTFSHVATGTAAGVVSGSRCDSCHGMAFVTEHNRVSSASAGSGCSNCHTAYAPTTWTATWDTNNGCAYTTCHAAASPRQPHTAMATSHTVTADPAEAACRGCHAGDLGAVHANSITTNAFVTNCNTCHTTSKMPTTKSCTDPACHAASGVTAVDDHAFNAGKHTSAPWTTLYQGTTPNVSTGGKECSVCHSARLDTAHATTSVGAISCTSGGTGSTGCHNNTSLTSQAVASANWTQKRCTQCHNSGANVSHDNTATPHAVAAGACAGTSGCHTSTDLWALHSIAQAGGAPKYASCANAGCHSAGNLNKRPSLKTCGTGNACHTDKTTTNHGSAHTLNAAGSAYNDAAVTGCTESGAGCHGAVPANYQEAHPASGCISGPCHTAPNHFNAAFNDPNTCQNCHGGGGIKYDNAPDVVALTEATPGGHYGETTHTAGGASTTVAAGGSATATCANCHNGTSTGIDGLYAQHQGLATSQVTSANYANVSCGECHNYSVAMTAVVTSSWPTKTCSACHTGTAGLAQIAHGTTAPVVNATSTSSCGATGVNCHTTYDVHALHKNAAGGCSLTGCHDYAKQGANPTLTTCGQTGGCHATYTANTAFPTHGAASMETTDHAPTNTVAQNDTMIAGIPCGSCHIVAKGDGGLVGEHNVATSVKSTNAGNICRNCHNNPNAAVASAIATGWAASKNGAGACWTCHAPGVGPLHTASLPGLHTETNTGCGATGVGCHNSSDLSQVGLTTTVNTNIHSTCLRCHDRTATAPNLAWNPANDTCGSGRECHATGTQYNTTTSVHNGTGGLADGDDATHHTAAGMTNTVGAYANNNTCATCHSATLKTAHATTSLASDASCSTGGTGNLGCHNSTALPNSPTQVKAGWTNNTCADCHTTSHTTNTVGAHTSLVGTAGTADGCVTGACHVAGATSDVRLIHDRASSGCSASGQDSQNGNSGANAACHAINKAMVAGTIGCGSGTTGATKCHVNHTNSNHGTSNGGSACYSCHSSYQSPMEDGLLAKTGATRAATVHHVMGSATQNGDIAPNTGVYPTSKTDVYCVSCHSDHNYFNGAASKAGNLRSDIANASGAATSSTDYSTTGAFGICVSCHNVSQTKQGMGTDQLNLGAASTPIIGGADFNASAHEYSVASAFGASSTFTANCSKCHSDEQAKQYATGTYKFGTHYSASAGILRALGAFAGNPPQEEACYKCHNATAAKYGETLSAAAKGTQAEFGLASTHDLSKVACANCHNVHEASAAAPVSDPDNTYNTASLATAADRANFCLKCHDGSTPSQTVNGATLVPYTVAPAANANIATFYKTDGHGLGMPAVASSSVTTYGVTANDVTGDWTNDANSLGSTTGNVASSPADNAFEMRHSFGTFNTASWTGISAVSVTVRSQALVNGWGRTGTSAPQTGLTQTLVVDGGTLGSFVYDGTTIPNNLVTALTTGEPDDAVDGVQSPAGAVVTPLRATTGNWTLPVGATITNVTVHARGRRDPTGGTGVTSLQLGMYDGTTQVLGTAEVSNPSVFEDMNPYSRATAPNGTSWDQTDLNNLQLVVTENDTGRQLVVTQMYAVVTYSLPGGTVTNDDTWAIEYTVNNGLSWAPILSDRSTTEAAQTDHTFDVSSLVTAANINQFQTRIVGRTVGSADNSATVEWDRSVLNVTYDYNSAGGSGPGLDCRSCHEQHGSSLTHLLKNSVDGQAVASYTDTADQTYCLSCHRSGGAAGSANIRRYYPAAAGGTAPAGMTRSGHRTKSAGTLPANSAMPCRSCHNPHGGANSGYMLAVRTQVAAGVDTLIGDTAGELVMSDASQTPANAVNTRRFCFSCHTTSDTSAGWNGSAMAVVPAGAQVVGISRTAGVLKLTSLPNGINGHKAADTHSCYLCHGDDFSGDNSVNVHNPTGGESPGGIACYTCHTVYQDKMEDGLGAALGLTRTASYHHVLGSATSQGDRFTYPTLSTDTRQNVYCLSCHVDHDKFSPFVAGTNLRAANLRAAYGDTAATGSNSDWSAGTGGVCIGCHSVELTRDNTDQKPEANSTKTASLTSAQYGASAHQYVANSTFTDATTFNADCVKCHDSEIDGGGMERGSGVEGFQTSANKFSTHSSKGRRLLSAMGVAEDPPHEEEVCFACHSLTADGFKATANRDFYNVTAMNALSQAIFGLSENTYGHKMSNYEGLHRPSPTDETNAYLSANRHVECEDCHGVHEATPTRHVPGGNATAADATANNVSGALTGATGVAPTFSGTNWTAPASYAAPAPATKEYQVCFKCHSGANANVTTWGGTGSGSWTNQGLEFSTTNQSYHPVVAGLPATDPGANGSSRLQTNDMRTGSTNGTTAFQIGDTMYCSDCHAQSSAGSMGPHGSAVKWLLKGPNQAWPYDTAAMNGSNNNTLSNYRTYSNRDTNLDTTNGLFCRNCHVLNGTEHTRGDHNVPCVSCHIRVPHGGKISRLQAGNGSSTTYPGTLPLRYTPNGEGLKPTSWWEADIHKQNGGSYGGRETCGISDGSCGGSHDGHFADGEHW